MTRSGGQILADQLVLNGADLAFCVPGESYLDLLDALLDLPVRVVTCRHEAAAANAAEAYGKLTGRPGVCMVTRGPGATHAATGVHTAFQDSTPMLLLIGQVPRSHRGREGFQEIDYPSFFGPIAKWAAEVPDAARIPELVQRAYHLAVSGRPGPVVLSLPEDVLAEQTDATDAAPARRVQASPSSAQIDALRARLTDARRPLLIAGGGDWTAEGARALQSFAEASGLPTAVSFRAMDLIDNDSPVYCGHVGVNIDPRLAERVRDADLILALGPRLGAATTRGYTLLEPPDPRQALIHAHPDATELGRVYRSALAITTGMPELAAGLVPVDGAEWADWLVSARADYVADREPPAPSGDGVDLGAVVRHVNERLGDEAVVTVGAGNYTFHVHRYHRWRQRGTLLGPTSGAMGYGLPAAMAAALVDPSRPVVCYAGDGCFQMQAHELATCVQEGLPVRIIVVTNGMLGTIRVHQERRFPGRVAGTTLGAPDFAALARAHGAYGEQVERTADFAAAFERALAADGPSLIEVVTDPAATDPR